jgi:hypothetical protein
MKTLISSALLMIGSFSAFSQDTLFTRSGQVILGKVYEINQTEIKYKKPSNPDGPLYTVSKEDITLIEFKNGNKEVFQSGGQVSQADNTYSNNNNSTNAAAPQVYNNYYGSPTPRPNVNVVLGMGMGGYGYGVPYWGGWGYRPYYRPYRNYYYGGGWGGGWRPHHHHRR